LLLSKIVCAAPRRATLANISAILAAYSFLSLWDCFKRKFGPPHARLHIVYKLLTKGARAKNAPGACPTLSGFQAFSGIFKVCPGFCPEFYAFGPQSPLGTLAPALYNGIVKGGKRDDRKYCNP
jgi:hypothetical protein